MYVLLIWAAKILQKTSRLFGNSGAAAPGLFVEKFSPRFLEDALKHLPEGVIVVSGTNGKTTTTKLIADVLKELGDRVMTNATGSNMTRGLVSTVVSKSTIFGKLPFDVAVLEVDEAYAAVLSRKIPIKGAVVLNVMRDQLDRFGEIDTTAELLGQLTESTTSFVVLNGFDARVTKLPTRTKTVRHYFGPGPAVVSQLKSEDDWHGSSKRPTAKSEASVVLKASRGNYLTVKLTGETYEITSQFEGAHNHLNVVAAFTALNCIKPRESKKDLANLLAIIKPAFGRGERIILPNGAVTILLIKNPSSFVQTMAATDVGKYDTVSVVINDAYADSRDVSWLWDVDFKELKKAKQLFTGGSRGYDMAVRLKHENLKTERVMLTESEIVGYLESSSGEHAVFCTYTAMLKLRKLLVKKGHVEQVK